MQVTSVSVNVRYSKQMADGSFKTIELGCEGTLNSSDDDWQEVQASLYHQLGDQMHYVFSGNGKGRPQNGPGNAVAPLAEAATPPVPSREHFCTAHQTEYRQFTKDGRTWYSHRHGNGWCKER
jgi:hypothetical protein